MLRRCCLTGFCALAGLHMLPRAVQAEGMLSRASEGVQVPVYDVVVVGTGLAGHCAALSAKLAGAQRVMMIDKAPLVGGHSADPSLLWMRNVRRHKALLIRLISL